MFVGYLTSAQRDGGGGGIEARPGTEKRCSHNLQSGPVKAWTAVFVITNISDRPAIDIAINLFGIVFKIYVYFVGGK